MRQKQTITIRLLAIDHSIEYGHWEQDLDLESNNLEMTNEPNKQARKINFRVLKTEYQAFWKSMNRRPSMVKNLKRKLNLKGLSTKERKGWRVAFERNAQDTSTRIMEGKEILKRQS